MKTCQNKRILCSTNNLKTNPVENSNRFHHLATCNYADLYKNLSEI